MVVSRGKRVFLNPVLGMGKDTQEKERSCVGPFFPMKRSAKPPLVLRFQAEGITPNNSLRGENSCNEK